MTTRAHPGSRDAGCPPAAPGLPPRIGGGRRGRIRRLEVMSGAKAGPGGVGALVRALERIGPEARGRLEGYEIPDSGDRLCVRLALDTASRRRARRTAKELVAYVWYDAFGERQEPDDLDVIELGDEPRDAPATGEQRPAAG
jgi:hypothetical protein